MPRVFSLFPFVMRGLWASGVAGAAFGLAPTASAGVIERIAAVVNDEVILLSEVDQHCQAALDEVPANLPLDEAVARKRKIRKQALDGLIDDLLLRQQVREHKISILPEEIGREIEQLIKANNLNEKQFAEALKLEGKTRADLENDIQRQLERSRLIELQMRDNPDMRSKLQIRELEVEEYYREHYSSSEKVRASHILFTVPVGTGEKEEQAAGDRARKVLKQLQAGAAFDQMAKLHSDDPSGSLGGDLGWFRRGDMVAAFEKAAFGLKKGELSDLVRTRFGFHIILVTDRATEDPLPMEKVQNEVRGQLHRKKFQQAIVGWLEELRRRSFIDYKL